MKKLMWMGIVLFLCAGVVADTKAQEISDSSLIIEQTTRRNNVLGSLYKKGEKSTTNSVVENVENQETYLKQMNQSLSNVMIGVENRSRQAKLAIKKLQKEGHDCSKENSKSTLKEKQLAFYCDKVKEYQTAYTKLKSNLRTSTDAEKNFVANSTSKGSAEKAEQLYQVATALPTNLNPESIEVPKTITAVQIPEVNQAAAVAAAINPVIETALVVTDNFPSKMTKTGWTCDDFELFADNSLRDKYKFSCSESSGNFVHVLPRKVSAASCAEKKKLNGEFWKEEELSGTTHFWVCIEEKAFPIYTLDWNPQKCSLVGKNKGDTWWAVTDTVPVTCNVDFPNINWNDGLRNECANPKDVKRQLEVNWQCNHFGHIIPSTSIKDKDGNTKWGLDKTDEPVFTLRADDYYYTNAIVGNNVAWKLIARIGDYADSSKICKGFLSKTLQFQVSKDEVADDVVKCSSDYPMDLSKDRESDTWSIYSGLKKPHYCYGIGDKKTCTKMCRTKCNVDENKQLLEDQRKISDNTFTFSWLPAASKVENYYPNLQIKAQVDLDLHGKK